MIFYREQEHSACPQFHPIPPDLKRIPVVGVMIRDVSIEEIGFKHGVAENRDKTWEQQVNGTTFLFSKKWEPEHKKFYYGCHTKAGNGNDFYASSDLDIEDLVKDERFVNIRGIKGTKG
jgi:hypothetical protein